MAKLNLINICKKQPRHLLTMFLFKTDHFFYTFEIAALRTILGVLKLEDMRNDEVRKRLDCTSTLVQLVYIRQHKWLGHVLCIDDERIAKMEDTR